MSNIIDSIRLSGTTYQIQGSGGGITVDPTLDSGSTNPVANSAITTALGDKVNVVDNEVPDYNVTSEITYQGGYPSQSETASTWDDASMFTLRYNYIRISDVNYTTTAAVIDPSNNITTGRVTIEESIANPLPDYIDMSFSLDDNAYRFTAKEGYRIAHLDIYNDKWATWGYIREERVDTVFEGGQSADVIKDVIEPTLINKQDKLVAGENITISGNVISSTGGDGKTLVAGRGIEITTEDTTNTISFNLPISGTGFQSIAEGGALSSDGYRSHAEGHNTVADGAVAHAEGAITQALGTNSHSEGRETSALTSYSHAEGYYTKTTNQSEHASGQFNISSSASTTFGDSGNTLFSVGNGSLTTRHNAFEIRQNGDIYLSSGGTDIKLQDHLGGSSITVDTALDSGSTNPVQNKVIYDKFDEVEEVTAAGLNALNDKITPTVELTQAEYDALTTKDPNTYYIITDAQAGDLTNYYTKTETNTLLGGKQATLVSGTNIKTINNESILGSGNIDIQGGSTYTAGRGISIANDAISVSLPISAGTGTNALVIASDTYDINNKAKGNYSVCLNGGGLHPNYAYGTSSLAQGMDTKAYGNACYSEGYGSKAGVQNNINIQYAHAEGDHTQAKGTASHAEGYYTIANNLAEHASGRYNISSSASTTFGDSGNTLFSVGNGTSTSARHNAFEIRQNGDIYLSSGGTDIKLQDHLGGGGGGKAVSGGTNISITTGETADTINCTLPITADTKNNYIFITNTTTFTSNKSENVTFGTNNHLDCNASFVVGGSNYVYGNGCFVYGFSNEPRKLRNGLFGDKLKSTNSYEFGFGQYNNSVSASTTWGDSGNTLFSVGNGTSSARHNAFEIRQNGDIYYFDGTNDVKLQDKFSSIDTTIGDINTILQSI